VCFVFLVAALDCYINLNEGVAGSKLVQYNFYFIALLPPFYYSQQRQDSDKKKKTKLDK
jgi:hypothetical protein